MIKATTNSRNVHTTEELLRGLALHKAMLNRRLNSILHSNMNNIRKKVMATMSITMTATRRTMMEGTKT
jgi:hypothetical protein